MIPTEHVGGLVQAPGSTPIGGVWYTCETIDSGFSYRFEPGTFSNIRYLTADFLLDGTAMVAFRLTIQEGDTGPEFEMIFALLPQCSARMRMPIEMLSQAKWRFDREGAWLKPMARGDRIDPAKAERMVLTVHRKSDAPVRFAMTELQAVNEEPPLLDKLILPRGKLLDDLGQSTIHDWPGKTKNESELVSRLEDQAATADEQTWPEEFSKWGGWTDKLFDGSGYFRTHHDGNRWWLLDPDGHVFWSAGPDDVLPFIDACYNGLEQALTWRPDGELAAETDGLLAQERQLINYLGANLHRAFGDDWRTEWEKIALGQLRGIGFNTIANWSDWRVASRNGFPYVRHLNFPIWSAPFAYRDLPDVYHEGFAKDAKGYAGQLKESAGDPALIGYFLMNEPTWGFSSECPAAGMLFTYESGPARIRFADILREKYDSDEDFAAAWRMRVSFADIESGLFTGELTAKAISDCEDFSAEMVSRFFTTLAEACRKVDPNHLNLGIRFHTVPPQWALDGMSTFDVFSMNCYRERVPSDAHAEVARLLDMPVMIGEWHFGALDAGLPASGIGHVRTQTDRGKAYRYYLETAAADPNCVGVHYFTLYDQSAIGRFDGEAYQIGFIDTCHRPYPEMCDAARASHEVMYEVAAGSQDPFDDLPEYLPKLFV